MEGMIGKSILSTARDFEVLRVKTWSHRIRRAKLLTEAMRDATHLQRK
jgi:hypothetical protein